MTIQQELLERLSTLPPSDQQELLRLARTLSQRAGAPPAKPWKSLMGAFAGSGIDITEADLDAARRDMWRDFPRDVE
jgi:hypothetical protein